MPTFANLAQFVTTVTDKLTKPRRGVGGSEGVLASDMLSALVDCGTYVSEGLDSIVGKANKSGDTFTGAVTIIASTASLVNPDVALLVGHTGGTSGIQMDSWGDSTKQVYLKNWNGKFELVAKNGINLRTDGTFAEDINFLTGADVRLKIAHNGNLIVGGLADNNLAKFQTPSISLGLNTWQYASDGTERLFYGSGITYHRVGIGGVMIMMFGSGENYNLTHNVFGLNNDSYSDISQFALTGAPGAGSRQWVHRKEASGVDYRFFDWNGSTARDWWNVYASTQKMSLAQIIHANYGSNVGIGTSTPDTSAILDLKSNTKGLLLPQLTTTERNAVPVSAARKGLLIINVTTNKLNFYNGSAWEAVTSA
ncbi:hypothetical protein GVN20_24760 [Runella sp. CRIBMP]|uniref:hypothetical protein n=1 Tax=Runella sp. CRIBMP TaxID=2683261 RepID=UPI0014129FDE|nr:hypothetical protein [Runella sp. CRIBMP]NBB22589.1 hypothetical protein [Runella sp. CRIBMP]